MLLKLLALKEAYMNKEDGATAIEYGLIAAGISLAIATVTYLFGDDLVGLFTEMQGSLNGRGS